MANIFDTKLTARMRDHLHGIDLQSLSRIDRSCLEAKALPNIGSIELVTSAAFRDIYDALYTALFPHRAERERSDLIIARLAAQDAGTRAGLAPYRIVGIRDAAGAAIGGAQFSVLRLRGGRLAVPYLQYIYVRAENRGQYMSEVLHMLVLGVAAADARALGRAVPFTLFETEPPGRGLDATGQAYSLARLKIHEKTGGVALVVVRQADGRALTPHVQPGLEPDDPPLTLLWIVRPSPGLVEPRDIQSIGPDLFAAYYQSLRDEGFPEENIRLAEQIVEQRCKGGVFQLTPLTDLNLLSQLHHD